MKSKDLLKKILPVGIALVVIALIAILISVLTKDKKNPTLQKDVVSEQYFTYEDGKIKFTNGEAYEKAKKQYGASALVDLIDKKLLSDEMSKVTEEEMKEQFCEAIFGTKTIDEYIEDNELEDDDATAEDEVFETLNDLVKSFVKNTFASYGVNSADDAVTLSETTYELTVKTDTAIYSELKLERARYNYAYAKLAAQYAEEAKAYKEYKEAYAKYEKYLEDLSDYNLGDLKEKPEEVSAPTEPSITIAESKFQEKYDEENVDGYWAVVIPYSSSSEAEIALLQQGVVVKTVYTTVSGTSSSKAYWFHYGVYDEAKDTEKSFTEDDYDSYNIITKSDFYKTIAQNYEDKKTEDNVYGAYVLTEEQIKQVIVNLYNQYYYGSKKTTVAEVEANEQNKDSQFYFTGSELTSMSLLTTVSGNKFNEFDKTNTDFRKFYSESVSSSYPKVYWILGASDVDQWEDLEDDAKNTYMAKADLVEEFLEAACTTTVINNKVDELRVEKGLIIYDTDLEADYLDTYTNSSYKETKKASKNLIAKFDGNEISTEDLFNAVSDKYAVAIALEEYQYQYMFLFAKDNNDELYNKYFDYEAFLGGKDLKKCFYKTDEAQDLWDEIAGKEGTIANIKNNFASGAYESYNFPATYGWKNFLRDFFSQYYGVTVTNNDELAVYLVYQHIVEDYQANVSDATQLDWILFQTEYVKTLNSYINSVGYHFLITVKDEDGNTVDPEEWTAEQIAAAEEFYGKLVALVKVVGDVDKEDVQTLVSAIATAYDSIVKYPVDDAGQLITDKNLVTAKGIKKFAYTYTYSDELTKYEEYALDLAKYKTLGLSVVQEDLTTTAGTMVKEFEDAVRVYWMNHLEEMLDAENDGEFEGIEYSTAANGYIKTSFGYHFYVNTSCNLTAYYSEDQKVTLPTLKQIALYQYENNNSTEEDYVSIVDLVADYVEAVQLEKTDDVEKAKKAVVNALSKVQMFKDLTMDNVVTFIDETLKPYTNFATLTEKSTATSKKIEVDDLKNNTFVQTQLTSWYTTIAEEYTGSYYYQLCVLKLALANASKIIVGDQDVAGLLQKYIDSYQAYLTYNKNAQDQCENILNALAYNPVLTKLFSEDDYNAVVAKAKSLYSSLTKEQQDEIKEAYDDANEFVDLK